MGKRIKSFLQLANEAHRKDCGAGVLICIMETAIMYHAFDDAHEIAVRYETQIGDDLVRRLQAAILASKAEERKK